MSCSEYQDKLFAYVDCLLDMPEIRAIETHLAECAHCRGEVEQLCELHERLGADGAAYAGCDIEDAVVDRIVREQTFKLRKAERPNVRIGLWRHIMNTKIAKFAAAAVVVVGSVFGYLMFRETGGVSWAEVAQRVAMVKAVSYRMAMTMRGMPGLPEGTNVETETVILMSEDIGMKMESYMGGKLISTSYLKLSEPEIVSLMPEQKKYMVVKLTDELFKEARKKNGDPKEFIVQMLSLEHTKLDRAEIDGVTVEGVESHDPRIMGGTSGQVTSRLWVDVETGWPVQMTMVMEEDNGAVIEMVMQDYQWDLEVDAAEFTAVIPEGYEMMGNLNIAGLESGEQLVSGLRLFAEMSGGRYPKELSPMKISQEFQEMTRSNIEGRVQAGMKPEAVDMQKILDITMMGTFAAVMGQQNRDFVYHGATVTAADAGKVLLRWRLEDGQYRVIFGDLRIEDVSGERLAELEGH